MQHSPSRLIIWVLALAGSAACRKHQAPPSASPPPAPAPPAPAPVAAQAAGDADVYFAAIAPHFERVSVYHGPEPFLREFAATPPLAQHLLAAHWCASEISNGGFSQFFAGAAGVMAPEAVAGLEAIGLPDNAALVTQAMAMLVKGTAPYPREMKARNGALGALKKRSKRDNPFDELDQKFFELLKQRPGGFDAAAAAYARAGAKR